MEENINKNWSLKFSLSAEEPTEVRKKGGKPNLIEKNPWENQRFREPILTEILEESKYRSLTTYRGELFHSNNKNFSKMLLIQHL